jgi:hypothetical protein
VFCSCSPTHRHHAEAGQPIVKAIYQYQQDTGSYPTNLAMLSPKHLKVVPRKGWEAGWAYGPGDYQGLGKGFMLSCWSVGYKTRVEYVDDRAAAGWRVNAEGSKTAMNLPSMKPSSNQQGGASGRQPSSSDANRASAAGASRRSP